MFEVEIDGKKVKAEVSFFTATLYEAEFQKDLIQDFFGVQTGEAAVVFEDGETIASIDFTKISWTATQRTLWAAIKTADENAAGFQKWMKSTSGTNLWTVREQLAEAVSDCFFRTEAAGAEA